MSDRAVHYYIYYRVAAERAGDARRIVATLLAAVEERLGIAGRLLHRADEPLLWMEIYSDVRDAPAFDAMLREQVDEHAFAQVLMPGSARTVERFVAGAP